MAKKISQLTQATEVKSDDVTVIVQDGETKKLPLNMMVTKQDIENKKVAGLAKLDEIETTYENDTYTPTITVKNKSSVKTGEGDEVDYSANVMDGHAKSAILSGNTLVNLLNKLTINAEAGQTKNWYSGSYATGTVKSGKYILLYNVKETSETNRNTPRIRLAGDKYLYHGYDNFNTTTGIKKWIFTADTDLLEFSYWVSDNTGKVVVEDFILLEYQEGMENWDIPYFEGMQSVKMPVLKTTGKNLFDKSTVKYNTTIQIYGDGQEVTDNNYMVSDFIEVKPNTTYTSNYMGVILYYDENRKFIGALDDGVLPQNLTTPNNCKYIRIRCWERYNTIEKQREIVELEQLEENSVATAYEPYKSNILTVNEDVTLRGIGDVKDELDCLTGEVTERISEIVLDGTQSNVGYRSEYSNDDYYCFMYDITKNGYEKAPSSPIGISCPIPFQQNRMFGWETAKEFVLIDGNNLVVKLLKSKLNNDNSISSLNTYLASNPITINYPLKTESVKTVDLMPSGTHPSTTPYCWKDGHIQLSSSGLLPNLEYSVVTSRAGQINQNATMIVKNDKRIFDLEILLAGGLVNTTYQALTLQNQVETGLSKVSLSSEKEPDYLLYHMIMKLIEEKAYKLDDLTEKVSVFYLYEKLSDEQFETIYSALYPFAEDEVVEEPVVEELPEVVEDEVII